MNSEIKVRSTLGEGSEFWFDLDFPTVESAIESSVSHNFDLDITGYQGPRRQILIVDDLDNNREVLVNFLTPLGFEIMEASSGADAIALITSQLPDLVVLDLVMPELDGLAVTRHLRQESAWQDLPIIIVSASTLPVDESQCYLAGANAFLAKPLNFAQLLRLLEQHLQLQWITQDGIVRSGFATPQVSPLDEPLQRETESIATPTVEELEQLLALAMEGEIREVLSQIDQWQGDRPQLIPFIQQVRPLVETCQLRKLKELLKQYLN